MSNSRFEAFKKALKEIDATTKLTNINILPELKEANVELINTGSLILDSIIGGGVPKGRIIEIYGTEASGKTSIALTMAANVQKEGGNVVFLDVEQAFDPKYAKKLGVDIDKLGFAQPVIAEDVLKIVMELASSNTVDMIVIDSVASMVPKGESEVEFEKATIGLLARLMSKALKQIAPVANKNNCTIVFLNQVRDNVGVIYGCLHGDNKIKLVDGRVFTMSELVNKKIEGEVYAYDEKQNKIVPAKIIDWHKNGRVSSNSDWLQIKVSAPGTKNGVISGRFTKNHEIYANGKWIKAEDAKVGDEVISYINSSFNKDVLSFLAGMSASDLSVKVKNQSGSFTIADNTNREYMEWKYNKLKSAIPMKKYTSNYRRLVKDNSELYCYSSKMRPDLFDFAVQAKNKNPLFFKNNISDMGLALLYMDDGTLKKKTKDTHRIFISMGRLAGDDDELRSICQAIYNHSGIPFRPNYDGISLDTKYTDDFFKIISKYVPECMQYKLPEKWKNQYEDFSLDYDEKTIPVKGKIVSIEETPESNKRASKNKTKYDLTIEGFHNYIVGSSSNGFLVHNSPTSTPGGRALKFYASQRIEVKRRGKVDDEKGNNIGNDVALKCVKNKIAPPFGEGVTVLTYKKGINKAAELFVLGEQLGVITKTGRTFYTDNPDNVDVSGGVAVQEKDGRIKIAVNTKNVIAEIETNQKLYDFLAEKTIKALEIKNGLAEYEEDTEDEEDNNEEFDI